MKMTTDFAFAAAQELSNTQLSEYLGLEVLDLEEKAELKIARKTNNIYAVIAENTRPWKATFVVNPQNIVPGWGALINDYIILDSEEYPFIAGYSYALSRGEVKLDLLIPKGACTPPNVGVATYQEWYPQVNGVEDMYRTISREKALLVHQFVQMCKNEDPAPDFSRELTSDSKIVQRAEMTL